jgi:hypothetical protein
MDPLNWRDWTGVPAAGWRNPRALARTDVSFCTGGISSARTGADPRMRHSETAGSKIFMAGKE